MATLDGDGFAKVVKPRLLRHFVLMCNLAILRLGVWSNESSFLFKPGVGACNGTVAFHGKLRRVAVQA